MLNEIYFIPNLRSNIISIGQIAEEGNKVLIRGEFFWVYDKEEKLLMKIKRSPNRLYKLLIQSANSECLLTSLDDTSKLWHAHLGHVNYQALSVLSKERMVRNLPKIVQPKEVCTGCLMSKQTKKQIPVRANFSAKKSLELVNGDLCGPITPAIASGKKYFFLLVDDSFGLCGYICLQIKVRHLKSSKILEH